LQAAFKALFSSLSVSYTRIAVPLGKSFDMIVDGKLITGLAEIEIRPVQSDAKKDFDF
jgi:hypothetical protein